MTCSWLVSFVFVGGLILVMFVGGVIQVLLMLLALFASRSGVVAFMFMFVGSMFVGSLFHVIFVGGVLMTCWRQTCSWVVSFMSCSWVVSSCHTGGCLTHVLA